MRRSPEVAQRLGVEVVAGYRLLFAGEVAGGPGRDGLVYFREASVEAYLERYVQSARVVRDMEMLGDQTTRSAVLIGSPQAPGVPRINDLRHLQISSLSVKSLGVKSLGTGSLSGHKRATTSGPARVVTVPDG